MRIAKGNGWIRSAGLTAAASATLLAGCGHSSDEARLRHVAAQGAGAVQPKPDDPTADMVNAVSSADGKPPVYLKFRLVSVPQVGQPIDLQVALVQEPKVPIDVLKVFLQPREGLALKSAATIDLGHPQPDATHMIPVIVVPQQPGVLSLAVTVLIDTEHESITRAYTVPLIVPVPQPAVRPDDVPASTAPTPRTTSR